MNAVLIDTNLLVLFVVGTADCRYITKHKRLSGFVPQDYSALMGIVSEASSVLVTPNTLTETSNLAAYIAEPAKREVFAVLQRVIASATEVYVPSQTASLRSEFIRLGLTDATILEACTDQVTLLTTDLKLYLDAVAGGVSAINFNHMRDKYLDPGV